MDNKKNQSEYRHHVVLVPNPDIYNKTLEMINKAEAVDLKKESVKYIQEQMTVNSAIIKVNNNGAEIHEVIVAFDLVTESQRANLKLFENNHCFKVTYIKSS